jgi:Asp-tRNA(Asn)/Glu-tRNA(Gln) amidotransferase B subunit
MLETIQQEVISQATARNIEVVERVAARLVSDPISKIDQVIFLLLLRPFYQFSGEGEYFRWANLIAKFLLNEFQSLLTEKDWTIREVIDYKVWISEDLPDILFLRHHGLLDAAQAREVFRQCWEGPDVLAILQQSEVLNRTEGAALAQIVAKHLAANPKVVADYQKGRKQSINSLIGPILREIKADANEVRKLLAQQVEQ